MRLFLPVRFAIAALVAVAVIVIVLSAPGSAHAYESFYPRVSAYVSSYSGQVNVTFYPGYSDYSCPECDKTVIYLLELHKGYSSYGPLVGSYSDETQYTDYIRFRVPRCSSIPRGKRLTYTISGQAVSPQGTERNIGPRTVSIMSCRY